MSMNRLSQILSDRKHASDKDAVKLWNRCSQSTHA